MQVDGAINVDGLPARVVSISASGPDALEAVQEIMKLFPPDGGPERCAIQGCHSPAVLRGPDGVGGFEYRCKAYTSFKDAHAWHIGPAPGTDKRR